MDVLLRRHRPQLIHAHFGTDAAVVLPLAKRHRIPLIITFHGYDLAAALHTSEAARYRAQLAELFDYASALLPVSQEMARRLFKAGASPEKTRVHYLGTPIPELLAEPAGKREGIVFVGRLNANKGVGDLIKAIALLPAELRRNTPITIIGDGDSAADLRNQARQISDADFTFTGWQSSARIAVTLDRSSVFCGPSIGESFGLAHLEAAVHGVPVVAYRNAGTTEAVDDERTGLLAEAGDIDGLARRLEQLLTDAPRAQRLGRAGQERARKSFNIAVQSETLEHYYDVISAGAAL